MGWFSMCCQHGGKAVTPSGPAMQQQMGLQHHGRVMFWWMCVEVWMMDVG